MDDEQKQNHSSPQSGNPLPPAHEDTDEIFEDVFDIEKLTADFDRISRELFGDTPPVPSEKAKTPSSEKTDFPSPAHSEIPAPEEAEFSSPHKIETDPFLIPVTELSEEREEPPAPVVPPISPQKAEQPKKKPKANIPKKKRPPKPSEKPRRELTVSLPKEEITEEERKNFLYESVSALGYGVMQSVKLLVLFVLRTLAKPVKSFLQAAGMGKKEGEHPHGEIYNKISGEIRDLKAELKYAKAGIKRVFPDPKRRHRLIRRYVQKGIKNHRYLLKTALNTALPVLAALVYLFTQGYWNSVTFALEVTYKNASLGYINDEAVYLEAQNLIEEKMGTGAYSFAQGETAEKVTEVSLDAQYKLKLVSLDELNDADTICDKVIESSAEDLTSACGVYIDEKFVGAVKNEADARTVFYNILAPYEKDAAEKGYTVTFAENVNYVQGLYSDTPGIILDANELATKVEKGNYLRIQKTVTQTEVVKVPFETIETKDRSKYQGYSSVTQEGVEGLSRVTTTRIYINGVLDSAQRETVVLREPVTEIKTVGGKGYYGGGWVGSPSSSGFLWPAPSCNNISSPYGYRSSGFHKGTDLTKRGGGANGTAIIASKDGVVEYAGYSNVGYGYMVLINHGDGYKTRYGHMLSGSICVRVGEEVYAGQQIGRVGSTGNSTGPHLHFEIIYYGEYKNPMNYISR